MISADDSILAPLDTDEAVVARVVELVGRAIRRQLWLMLLDDDSTQLPLLIPLDGLPVLPAADDDPLGLREQAATDAVVMLSAVQQASGAAAVIAVLERPGPDPLAVDDRAWASVLDIAARSAGISLRGVLLSSDEGVRWIGPEDRG